MWIFPKSIISASAQAMEASTSDFDARWAIKCEQLLMRRSKRSLSNCYLREWKMGNLTRLRYGLICDPSLGKSLLTEYLSSVEVIPVSRFRPQEEGKVLMMPVTSGHSFEMELPLSIQPCVSSKTSKDIFRWDSPASSVIWKKWVIELRGEYSQRVKSAHLIRESGSSSWPTPKESLATKDGNWTTPAATDTGRTTQYQQGGKALSMQVIVFGLHAPANPSADGSRQESWATPQARDWKEGENPQLHGQKQIQLPLQAGAGKLNPRWVETLMGLPVGWTMPSCASPVTIAQMNCDC